MRKGIGAAQHHPTNRSLEEFRDYWRNAHGPMGSNLPALRRYVQHITIPEAYGGEPAPTFDGVSMFWFEDSGITSNDPADPMGIEMSRATRDDDIQLFDRTPGWPGHHKRASVTAEEHVIVDGATTPDMVKVVFIVAKMPGLSFNEFFEHWEREHADLVKALPGLRRYIQNHAVREAYAAGGMTHDGFSELWFDDLAALRAASASPQWAAMKADGETLFGPNIGVIVTREFVQKEFDWTYYDWGVGELDEATILDRLTAWGYAGLAADPEAATKIKKAAENKALAIFNSLHIVTIDESRIDVRPGV